MVIRQVTVKTENREGQLQGVMDVLSQEKINVEALSVADTVMRLIVEQPGYTAQVLKEQGYQAEVTRVLRIKVPSRAGSLAQMLTVFAREGINLEYMYAFATGEGDEMILRPSDLEKADVLLADFLEQ